MGVVLYWMAISHPSRTVRRMLEEKGIPYDVVEVLPLGQRIHLRAAGFSRGTVPAIKLDGRRIQGSRAIARALDERWPEPPLFPSEPLLRARVEEAERWGDEQFQPVPRRLFRFGVAQFPELRQWAARRQGFPAPDLVATAMRPAVNLYARTVEADGRRATGAGVRADLAALPAMLDHVDRLIADGTLTLSPPNAATLQVLSTVQTLCAFDDLRDFVRTHGCADPAERLFDEYPARLPRFLPQDWLDGMIAATASRTA